VDDVSRQLDPDSGDREQRQPALAAPAQTPRRRLIRRVYERWRRAAHALGVVHTRAIMLAIYAVVVVPTGLLMRRFRDPLRLRPPEGSNWIPLAETERDLAAARRQY
jgi:hypothetical protein